jgi:Spy/CpxP family protein refolding chaperone
MRKSIVIGLALGVGVVALSGFGGGCWHHRHDPERMAEFVTERVDDALDDVNATSEQREKIHAVKDRMLARAKELHGDRAAARATILEAWKADAPDAAKLHALVDERADAMRALAHEAVDAGIEVHGILTPEQRAKLAEKAGRRMHR